MHKGREAVCAGFKCVRTDIDIIARLISELANLTKRDGRADYLIQCRPGRLARFCLLAVNRITRGGRGGWSALDRDRKGDELNRLLRGRYYDIVKSIKRRIKAAIKPPRERESLEGRIVE